MKRRLLITLVLLLLCIGGIGWFSYMQQKTVVLKFGMFAGSNWDVPNGDSYKIIDQAIERFEKAHPNVRVEYVSGLQKRITLNGFPSRHWKVICRMYTWCCPMICIPLRISECWRSWIPTYSVMKSLR